MVLEALKIAFSALAETPETIERLSEIFMIPGRISKVLGILAGNS